jgi:hypothetical protein
MKKEQQKQLLTEIMEDEINKLAHQYNPVMKLDAEFIRAGFKAGYNKAKETLYTEISDEEIQKQAFKYVYKCKISDNHVYSFIDGIRWYREQLKRNI